MHLGNGHSGIAAPISSFASTKTLRRAEQSIRRTGFQTGRGGQGHMTSNVSLPLFLWAFCRSKPQYFWDCHYDFHSRSRGWPRGLI